MNFSELQKYKWFTKITQLLKVNNKLYYLLCIFYKKLFTFQDFKL